MREVRVVGAVAPDIVARAALAGRLATLEDVLRVGLAQRPSWDIVEVIVQDEFTHDVIVGGPAPGYLVFDTT